MRRLLSCFACLVSTLLLLPPPSQAFGSPGLLRPLPGEIRLGFNDPYPLADGSTNYHTGVDLEGMAGERVSAAAGGVISFRGYVPRPAGDGPPLLALTVAQEDGRLCTYFPFSSVSVVKGAAVREGDGLGELAGEGDASSAGCHVHVGLRENSTYVDPAPFHAPAPAPAAPAPRAESEIGQTRRESASHPLPRRTIAAAEPVVAISPATHAPSASLTDRAVNGSAARASQRRPNRVRPDQRWRQRLLLKANQPSHWLDPGLLKGGEGRRDTGHGDGLSRPPGMPRLPVRASILLVVSGTLLCAAAQLGRAHALFSYVRSLFAARSPLPAPAPTGAARAREGGGLA